MLGGGAGLLLVPPHFCWGGGVGAAKSLLPSFLVPKGNQPTACTLALWWLKFGPTEGGGGGGPSLGQPKIFRCGSLCCCVGGCVVGQYHLHPLHSPMMTLPVVVWMHRTVQGMQTVGQKVMCLA